MKQLSILFLLTLMTSTCFAAACTDEEAQVKVKLIELQEKKAAHAAIIVKLEQEIIKVQDEAKNFAG